MSGIVREQPTQRGFVTAFYQGRELLVEHVKWSRFEFSNVMHYMRLWMDRVKQRRELMDLNDRLLEDIGLTRAEAEVESQKPFWKA